MENLILKLIEEFAAFREESRGFQAETNLRFDKIETEIEGLRAEVKELRAEVADIKENTDETREVVNIIGEWCEKASPLVELDFPVRG
jgi:uncharacterized coiled-coil DUF342 family protein